MPLPVVQAPSPAILSAQAIQTPAAGRQSVPVATRATFSDRLLAAVRDLADVGRQVVQHSQLAHGGVESPASATSWLPSGQLARPIALADARVKPPGKPAPAATVNRALEIKPTVKDQTARQATAPVKTTDAPPAAEAQPATQAIKMADPRPALEAQQTARPTEGAAPTSAVMAAQPAAPIARVAKSNPLSLADFPRPAGDNGRGMHWIPTTRQDPAIVDRYVQELKDMKIKWVVFLNEDTDLHGNEYLVSKLVDAGILPVMRIYTPNGAPIRGDIKKLVEHFLPRGVSYYQLYNEPNLSAENEGRAPNVAGYLDKWIPAAKAVAEAGGLPGFGALAPGGELDDLQFLRAALDEIVRRGEVAVLDRAWLSMHNYLFNRPLEYDKDSNGFAKFRWYDQIVREKIGRSMPIVGTEGGSHVGAQNDGSLPPLSELELAQRVLGAYEHVASRKEPYNFAYTYWLIANEAGGGRDPSFSHQALFRPDGVSPLVQALKQ